MRGIVVTEVNILTLLFMGLVVKAIILLPFSRKRTPVPCTESLARLMAIPYSYGEEKLFSPSGIYNPDVLTCRSDWENKRKIRYLWTE